jgi:diadenosine tetraphosphatase ApaH/serine/threonine PP2A family protein phosphatase
LIVAGSVGQPRDGNPAASWLLLDTAKREVTFRRTPYDVEAAAAAIRAKGLPDSLAERLSRGA